MMLSFHKMMVGKLHGLTNVDIAYEQREKLHVDLQARVADVILIPPMRDTASLIMDRIEEYL